jgi:hypothetical protein
MLTSSDDEKKEEEEGDMIIRYLNSFISIIVVICFYVDSSASSYNIFSSTIDSKTSFYVESRFEEELQHNPSFHLKNCHGSNIVSQLKLFVLVFLIYLYVVI